MAGADPLIGVEQKEKTKFWQGLKDRAGQLKHKVAAVFLAYKHKDTPWYAKLAALITVGYALSPIDLIPDFIPVLGYLDDMILLPLMVALCVRLIPKAVFEQCELQAQGMWQEGKPKRWVYALPIVLIWLLILGLIAKAVFF